MKLDWLPLRGRLSPGLAAPPTRHRLLPVDSLLAGRLDVFRDALRHLVLPAFTLSLGGLATIARFTRAGVLDTLQKDFVDSTSARRLPAARAHLEVRAAQLRGRRHHPDRPAVRRR